MECNECYYGEYEEEEEVYSQPMVSTWRPYATSLEAGQYAPLSNLFFSQFFTQTLRFRLFFIWSNDK